METVKVAVRIRPMVQSELEKGCQEAVVRIAGEPQIVVNNDSFTFNYVFDAQESQEKLFDHAIMPMLEKFHSGFNVTILAYGQTGSGKTFTMGTAFNGVLDENAGVIPRVMNEIFRKVRDLGAQYDFEVSCSFLELYQEQLYDLLSEKSREQSTVEIREDKNGIHIPDLTFQVVQSALETTDCLMRGSSGRAVASTAMNELSSRSHAIFTVTLKYVKKDEPQTQTIAKFHLVDLAGSERSKKTKATGERFKEGVKINQGLLALGNVISALGTENGQSFVRYRDSKLTRLLQDSLGGNSCTLMIACVSPADYNIQETLSTLRYADRARKIKNKPVVNQDPHAAEVNRLKGIIQNLRVQLLACNSGSSSSLETIPSIAAPSPRKTCNDKMYRDLQEKYRNLQIRFQKTLHDVVENEMRAHIAEVAHEKLKARTDEIKSFAKELALELNSKEQRQVDKEKVLRLIEMYKGLDEELENTVSEMNDHKKLSKLNISTEHELGDEDGAEIETQAEEYNNKQFLFKEELSRLNDDLNIKEQLQQRILENLNKFSNLETSNTEKYEEFEQKIRELENEKHELLDKLQHVKENASAKLAEERRRRLLVLEHEINEMKRKIKQQSSLLKVREKEKVKIANLQREIQSVKEAKVKLIRSMRKEADDFRQWKLTREKELIQMKNKGRKMENEMARKEAMHTKQRNVLKRKCEEAMAINKRLKDALERQSVAQAQRQKQLSSKDNNTKKIEHVVATVERELEVIISIIDAEQSLDYLMEDRAVINRRIIELRKNDSSKTEELAQLEEECEMRNAQITELQQKVCAADLETRIRAVCDTAQNMSEARAVFKHLTNTMCDMRRENATRLNKQKIALDECRSQRQQAEEDLQLAVKRIKLMEKDHKETIVTIERQYEEKLALLLNTYSSMRVNNADSGEQNIETREIEEDFINKIEAMREEIEHLNTIIEKLQAKKAPKAKPVYEEDEDVIDVISDLSNAEFLSEDTDDDPDWRKTPAIKRRRTERSNRSKQSEENSENDTYTTAKSQTAAVAKGKSTKGCSCRTGCQKRCGCRLNSTQCSLRCRCQGCTNGRLPKSPKIENCDADDEDFSTTSKKLLNSTAEHDDAKENIKPIIDGIENDNSQSENEKKLMTPTGKSMKDSPPGNYSGDEHARRMARLTQINFVTPTSKKKFFD